MRAGTRRNGLQDSPLRPIGATSRMILRETNKIFQNHAFTALAAYPALI